MKRKSKPEHDTVAVDEEGRTSLPATSPLMGKKYISPDRTVVQQRPSYPESSLPPGPSTPVSQSDSRNGTSMAQTPLRSLNPEQPLASNQQCQLNLSMIVNKLRAADWISLWLWRLELRYSQPIPRNAQLGSILDVQCARGHKRIQSP